MTSSAPDSAGQVRAARSFLFVPGDRPERFDKAAAAGADVVIVDLEDAVGADHKDSARSCVVDWLGACGRAAVRVNSADAPEHEADLAALAALAPGSGLVAVVLPKADDPATATAVAARAGVPVVALVESAAGMVAAPELARADGVARLAFGHLDYAVDLGAGHGRAAMQHARSTLVLASRAAGLPGPVDGVTTALDDRAVLDDDLAHARDLGLTGKLLIHPRQVGPTHDAYRPTVDEVAWAEKVMAAVADAGTGAVRVDGDMVDPPVVARAHQILRRKDR